MLSAHSCSSITFDLLASQIAPDVTNHVSSSLNVTFHSPAVLSVKPFPNRVPMTTHWDSVAANCAS